ncbi:MAG: Gfo/Idh/MocA family oxidoreductase [Burkholderiales bacterium]|nr:Gfo/Idh/MocA family oxidoreductase [Burkholderiales bacterium]
MSSRIRIALLGVEQPHANFWQAAIRGSPHAEVAGVYSDTPGLAASFAEKYGFAATGDLPALIDAADAVAICSVTTRHADLIEMAAAKGRKILCEKPLATSIAHLDRIERAVADAGVFFMQGFPKRYDPVNHEIKRIVDSGRLGPIHCVRVRHGHPVGVINPAFAQSWFTDPALGGFGALLDEGCHACDFLRWLFGEPESVICMTAGESLGLRVEDVGIAVYRFPGGLLAEVASSWGFIGAENSIEIFGSRGAIVVSGVDLGSRDLTEGGYLKIYALDEAGQAGADHLAPKAKRWTISPIVPQFKADTEVFHQNVAKTFIDCIVNNKPAPCTLKDGRRAVEMVLAAYQSHASGRREPMPPPRPDAP